MACGLSTQIFMPSVMWDSGPGVRNLVKSLICESRASWLRQPELLRLT